MDTINCTPPRSIPKAPTMNRTSLAAALKEESLRLGFDLVGATPATSSPDFDRLRQWLAGGNAGQMRYFADRLDAYRHPSAILAGARSILMLAMNYRSVEPADAGPGQARVARYAWGTDYHEVIRVRLRQLADFHRLLAPHGGRPRRRRYRSAFRAALRPIGRAGLDRQEHDAHQPESGQLVLSRRVADDRGTRLRRAGRRGLLWNLPGVPRRLPNRCPGRARTSSMPASASVISPSKCGATCPRKSTRRAATGSSVVTPARRRAPGTNTRQPAGETAFYPGPNMNPVEISELLALDEEGFRRRFRHTPLWRAKREGILRNVNGSDWAKPIDYA